MTESYSYAGITEELVQSQLGIETTTELTTITNSYVHAKGVPLALQRSVTTTPTDPLGQGSTEVSVRLLGVNPHGDVTYLTDRDGGVLGTRTYDPYGEVRSELGEDSDLGFQGDPTDADTGLVDMGARNYAPELGRFTTVDPIAGKPTNPLSMNPYLYGVANPVTNTDPTGECADPEVCPPPPGSNKRTRKTWNEEADEYDDRQERYYQADDYAALARYSSQSSREIVGGATVAADYGRATANDVRNCPPMGPRHNSRNCVHSGDDCLWN